MINDSAEFIKAGTESYPNLGYSSGFFGKSIKSLEEPGGDKTWASLFHMIPKMAVLWFSDKEHLEFSAIRKLLEYADRIAIDRRLPRLDSGIRFNFHDRASWRTLRHTRYSKYTL